MSKKGNPSRWLKGSMVALVTPFRNGEVDVTTLQHLVEFHVQQGTSAIVPCGTTGNQQPCRTRNMSRWSR